MVDVGTGLDGVGLLDSAISLDDRAIASVVTDTGSRGAQLLMTRLNPINISEHVIKYQFFIKLPIK
jgi:hypothetical protein